MKQTVFILLFALLCPRFLAQEADLPQYNFLFIVDTSISMAARKPAAISVIRELITSGFNGQIAEGDSIDIWTCDTETHIAAFPPQIWDTNRTEQIALAATTFVEHQKFRARSRAVSVAGDLGSLLPNTKGLLVILITDGDEPISGTGFDSDINGQLPALRRRLQNAKSPFIISLSAVGGQPVDWKIFGGQGRPPLPLLPKRIAPEPKVETAVALAPAPEPVPEKTEPPAPTVVEFPPGARITPVVPPAVETREEPVRVAAAGPDDLPEVPNEKGANSSLVSPAKIDPAKVIAAKDPAGATASPSLQSPVSPPVQTESTKEPAEIAKAPVEKTTESKPTPAQLFSEPASAKLAPPAVSAGSTSRFVAAGRHLATNKNPDPQVAVAEPSLKPLYFATGAGILLLLVGGALIFRRPRRPEPSLISKSFDR